MCLIFILLSSVDFDMLMSTIEYKHSYLNIIVADSSCCFVLRFAVIFFKILIGIVKICCFLFSKIKHLQHCKNVLWKISINSVDRTVSKC